MGYERLVFLSEAIFAIAITLLVLNFKTPAQTLTNAELTQALLAQSGTFFSYVLTIVIVGRYWVGHHPMFVRLALPPSTRRSHS